jgi:replicative DNA helicase
MNDRFPGTAETPPDLKTARRRKTPPPEAARVDRLPPHSTEAEQGVLGCILHAPKESLGECLQRLRADAEVFYDLRHQTIYRTLVEMYDRNEAIDILTLQQRLADQKQLEAIGGIAYLNALYDSIPSPANLPYYLEIVQEKFLLRKMIRTCTDVIGRVYDFEGNVEALLDQVESEVLRLNESRVQSGARPIQELLGTAIQTVENFFNRKGDLGGIPTGFPDLDKMTDGLHAGEMVVFAARPSMGKTSLAMNIVEHVVLESKLPVAVFSLEMTGEALALRMLCSLARVNLRNIREGFMSERDFRQLREAAGKMARAPLFIDETPGLSILQLRARARRLAQQHNIKLFVVDYLQLLHSTSRRAQENRQQEIAEISGGIKALAKELNVPVIVLSQLNRELERDKNRRPRLSDLRESGAIEQDADVVGLLYKPSTGEEDEESEEADGVPVNLLIAKQRNGPTGDVNLTFLKSFTRFVSAAKVSDDDVPKH